MAGEDPDIIHAHEWQLSAVPMLYWWGPSPSLLTCWHVGGQITLLAYTDVWLCGYVCRW